MVPSGVRLGVDIADLLHLEAALQADRVVDAAADEEYVVRVRDFGGEPLQALLVLQDPPDLVRDSGKLFEEMPVLLF